MNCKPTQNKHTPAGTQREEKATVRRVQRLEMQSSVYTVLCMPCAIQHKVHHYLRYVFISAAIILFFCCSKRREEEEEESIAQTWSDEWNTLEDNSLQCWGLALLFGWELLLLQYPCKIFMAHLHTHTETKLLLLQLLPNWSHESFEQWFTVWFNT